MTAQVLVPELLLALGDAYDALGPQRFCACTLLIDLIDTDNAGHPECAARVPAILSALEAGGLNAEARPQQVRCSTAANGAAS